MKTAWWVTVALSTAACVPTSTHDGTGTAGTGGAGGSVVASSSSAGTGGGASTSSTSSTTTSTSSTTTSSGAPDGGATAAGTIVPLYTYPTDASWTAIVTAAAMHPAVTVWAIINPDSGPGTSSDPSYASGIPPLAAAGITVLAYVATTYGAKPTASVHAEIDAYKSWYPGIGGIFFDEMSVTAGDEAYYTELSAYAKSQGYGPTVGNPGTDTLASYVGTVDTILIYESSGVPALSTLGGWHTQYPKSNFGVIPYGVPALDTAFVAGARADVGFVYLTNDTLPNPWDTLSPYFSGLLAALE